MKAKISDSVLPVLEITLESGEQLISEPGQFSWMTSSIGLQTTAAGGAKGLFGALGRAISGGGLFMNTYRAEQGTGTVAFAAKVPGKILDVQIVPGQSYLVHRHGFLCGTTGVEVSIGFQRSLGAGMFGGEGMILQKLGGSGEAWIELGGDAVVYDLLPGQILRVHPGHVGMIEASVNFDITMMKGIKNALFASDGLFIAELTGPGRVWLQTLTIANLAHALIPYLPKSGK